jgi:sn-glycerol 3-phosphate transport system substrate-binding protein
VIQRRTLLGAALAAPVVLRTQNAAALNFYYPATAGDPVQAVIDGYCADFQRESGITVTPLYAGNDGETLTKVMDAIRAGQGPHLAVLPAAEMHGLCASDIVVSLDEIGLDDAAQRWLAGFYPAFMVNSRAGGRTWSVPFQRFTVVAYYNKTALEQGGIKPTYFPVTWTELADTAGELVKRTADGRVTRWGLGMAADLGHAQDTFGALANQAGQKLMNEAGNQTYFDAPKTIEALTYWRDLASKYRASSPGVSTCSSLALDFLQGDVAIIWHTSRMLTAMRDKAGFPCGVATPPGKESPHTVVGGGNLYILKNANSPERIASLRFARWLSAPERAADWSVRTGFIATSPAAYEMPALKVSMAQFPEVAIVRESVPLAAGALSTFENQRVRKALTDQIQAVLTGVKDPAQAMADAQAASTRILQPFL